MFVGCIELQAGFGSRAVSDGPFQGLLDGPAFLTICLAEAGDLSGGLSSAPGSLLFFSLSP